jgi:nitrite reductase/ring-hydroxylating ferredoxin subunit
MDQPGYKQAVLLKDLLDNKSVEVEVENMALMLHRRGEKVYATGVYCPHAEVLLDPRNVTGDLIICKAHGYRSNIKTGECMEEPDIKLNTFPTLIEDGMVWVKLVP